MAGQSKSDRWFPLIPLGLGLVLVLMGGVALGLYVHFTARFEAMRSWPTVEGTVTGCSVNNVRKPGETWDDYRLVTGFSYVVDGRPYSFTTSQYAGRELPSAPLPYVALQKVRIRYAPGVPVDAGVEGPPEQAPLLALIVGCGLCLLSAPFWFFGGRALRRNLRQAL